MGGSLVPINLDTPPQAMTRMGAASLRSRSRLMPLAAACVAAATLVGPACFADLVQPKRPMNSYMLFMNENRAKIAKGGKSVTEVTKEGGKQWGALSAKSKEKYEKDLAAFMKAGGVMQGNKKKGSKK